MSRDSSFDGSDYQHPEPHPGQIEEHLERLRELHTEQVEAAEAAYVANLGAQHATEPAEEPEPAKQEVVVEAGLVDQLRGLYINVRTVITTSLGTRGSASTAAPPTANHITTSAASPAASTLLQPLPKPLEPADVQKVEGKPIYVIWEAEGEYARLLGLHHCSWSSLLQICRGVNPISVVRDCKRFEDINMAIRYYNSRHQREVRPRIFVY
jgi:hypothetical protein